MNDVFNLQIAPLNTGIAQAYNQTTLSDDPEKHRWRAHWEDTYDHGNEGGYRVCGILLIAYPVLRKTPKGAWIDRSSLARMAPGGEVTWDFSGRTRWVSDDGAMAFAKPTREQALHSLAYRLMRWHQKSLRDLRRVHQAAAMCRDLLPQYAEFTRGIE